LFLWGEWGLSIFPIKECNVLLFCEIPEMTDFSQNPGKNPWNQYVAENGMAKYSPHL
jgi:hypothetical protein